MLSVTLLYTALLALLAVVLSARVGLYRGKVGISILFGDPPDHELEERVRVHQNFAEYVPLVLILMAGIELTGGNTTFLHVIGVALIVARLAHAIGLKHDNIQHPGRFIGAAGTTLLILACIGYGLWLALAGGQVGP